MVASLLSPSTLTQKTLPSSFSKFSSFYLLPVVLFFSLCTKTISCSLSLTISPVCLYRRWSFFRLFVLLSYLSNSDVQFFKQCLISSFSIDIYPCGYGCFGSYCSCNLTTLPSWGS